MTILKFVSMTYCTSDNVKNIVENREIIHYEQFLHFLQCFHKFSISWLLMQWIEWKGFKDVKVWLCKSWAYYHNSTLYGYWINHLYFLPPKGRSSSKFRICLSVCPNLIYGMFDSSDIPWSNAVIFLQSLPKSMIQDHQGPLVNCSPVNK